MVTGSLAGIEPAGVLPRLVFAGQTMMRRISCTCSIRRISCTCSIGFPLRLIVPGWYVDAIVDYLVSIKGSK
jgi:hypothetical protein